MNLAGDGLSLMAVSRSSVEFSSTMSHYVIPKERSD